MSAAPAPAKLNLALAVGPVRPDGKHELTTVYQRITLHDRIELRAAPRIDVEGFRADTLVRAALEAVAERAGVAAAWRARIRKRIPAAAGLGGGSSDAATALRLASASLAEPLPVRELHELARALGADVPFFLEPGPQLGEGDGADLSPLELPQDYWVVLVLPRDAAKQSTAAVYAAFDARDGAAGYDERRAELLAAAARARRPRDLAALPPNDLSRSPLADELTALGAFRADVTGAGPSVYGLFSRRREAEAARARIARHGRSWIAVPAWYG